ncbi:MULTISPECIES: energy-coupled thiamine transporter ThiT [Anaerococcus]|uniref:Putative proton-coupled thiamine transporter YuaJ n=1 Tax=Anaerococcus prevotii ACS-065-V-Col13 TaxID=879305 RepID=F0GVU2_9FIRM|nr:MULTISPECIES: energy-coupled thiamine transporter ThiT [Anaerococcus]EGC82076.1 putative proton-coupled thiamine transporter YuaJ [Anaerococcus prevotii ACS-065-V-Col13]
MKKNWTVKMLVEGGLCIALSFVLGYIKLFSMPQGGSVTAGEMIPIIIFALRHGSLPGIVVGALYGFVQMLFGGSIFHPVQAILDYPVAFGVLGLAGLFSSEFEKTKSIGPVIKGASLGIVLRMIAHTLTGAIFFASYAPEGQNPWAYSIIYNASYLVVEFAITIVIIYLLRNVINKDLQRV